MLQLSLLPQKSLKFLEFKPIFPINHNIKQIKVKKKTRKCKKETQEMH